MQKGNFRFTSCKARKDYFFINSTLLFFAFPSSVLLSAIGFSSPKPAELKRVLSIPPFTIASITAFALASDISQEVHIIKVIEEKEDIYNLDMEGSIKERQFTFAYQITEELKKLGESLSVNTFSEVEIGTDTESVILEMAKEKNFDLIVLGTDIRPGSEKLYIGPRVERVLNNAPCPVLLVNSQ